MRKLFIVSVLIVTMMLCLFTGCSSESENEGGKAVSYTLATDNSDDGSSGQGVLIGFDENDEIVWTFKTDEFPYTELISEAQNVGIHNGLYYVATDTLYAVDPETGEEVWRNDEYPGAYTSYDFDPDGNMYVCGYYGPHLAVITPDGDMKECYERLSINGYDPEEFYFAYYLEYVSDNEVTINFESNNTIVTADPQTGDAFVQSGSSSSSSSSSSQGYTDEEICRMAADTYYQVNGERPPLTAVESADGNIVTVHLYEDLGDHTATWARYDINLNAMTATDTVTGKTYDLVY